MQTLDLLDRHRAAERAVARAEAPAAQRRRRVVVAATLVVYAALLAWSLRIPAGDPLFYPATLLLAAALLGGALLAGRPLRPELEDERGSWSRRLGTGTGLGLALLVLFLVGATVVAQVPALRAPVDGLLAHASAGSLPALLAITALNGVVEEKFYRGAFYDAAAPWRPVLLTTVVYAVVAGLSGVPLLAVAALLVGGVCALLRRWSRGIVAPVACHLTWSLGMLLLLPRVLALV